MNRPWECPTHGRLMNVQTILVESPRGEFGVRRCSECHQRVKQVGGDGS